MPADVVVVVEEYRTSEFAATLPALYELGPYVDEMLDAMVGSEFVNVETKLWKSLVGNGATMGGEGPLPENGAPAADDVGDALDGVVTICAEELVVSLGILVLITAEGVELGITLVESPGI